ncbi:MAG TPA: hypothetical protein VMU06_19650 [Stellaceae bacterium]|nr:hypothetical protein [Stellaceae bacterium]
MLCAEMVGRDAVSGDGFARVYRERHPELTGGPRKAPDISPLDAITMLVWIATGDQSLKSLDRAERILFTRNIVASAKTDFIMNGELWSRTRALPTRDITLASLLLRLLELSRAGFKASEKIAESDAMPGLLTRATVGYIEGQPLCEIYRFKKLSEPLEAEDCLAYSYFETWSFLAPEREADLTPTTFTAAFNFDWIDKLAERFGALPLSDADSVAATVAEQVRAESEAVAASLPVHVHPGAH